MKKIVLDAGHGYNTAGKRTPDGVREWSLNNAVCNYIAEYLKGYDVQITRTDDTTGKTDVALKTRVAKTNSINPHIFVSIHHNAYNGKWNDVTGTEVYSHTQGTATDKKLANLLAPKISKETGLKNRGAKTSRLAVLGCKSSIPAVLCEGGFMDSRIDNPVITSEKGQRAYAKAVADGIVEFLGLTKKATTQATPKPTTNSNYLANTSYKGSSIAEALKQIGVDSSYSYRAKLAAANGIKNYKGLASQNTQMLNLLKQGKLVKVGSTVTVTNNYYPVPNYRGSSIVEALNKIGVNSSYTNRAKIASKNGIKLYVGTSKQNTQILNLLKQGKLLKV